MSIFQKLYDSIRSFQLPKWLKILMGQLNDVMIAILKKAGQDYISFLKAQVLEAARHDDWTSEKKFDYVFNKAKNGFVEFSITLKDNELNAIINFIVAQFKSTKIID